MRKFGEYVVGQGMVQALGFTIGLLIIRELERDSYAQYAVVTSLVAALVVVSDSGMTSVLLSRGASVKDDPGKRDAVFSAVMAFRMRVALAVGLVGAGITFFLLLQNGTSIMLGVALAVLAAGTLGPNLAKGVSLNWLRLSRKPRQIQLVGLAGAVARLLLIVIAWLCGLLSVLSLSVLLLGTLLLESFLARRFTREVNWSAPFGDDEKDLVRKSFRSTLPMTLVMVIQSQLLVGALSILGSSDVLAIVAAASRFAIIFAVANAVVLDLFAERVASAGSDVAALRRMAQVLCFYGLFCAILVASCFLLRHQVTSLMGPSYAGFESAVIIVIAGSAAINFGNAWRTLNFARGWVRGSFVYAPVTVAWLVLSVWLLDLGDPVEGAIFMAAQCFAGLASQLVSTASRR